MGIKKRGLVLIMNALKKYLPLIGTILLAGCGSPLSFESGQPVPPPSPTPLVRLPAVGQEWSYIQRDMFQGQEIGVLLERVNSVGAYVVIGRTMTSTLPKQSLLSDIALGHTTRESGQLANEVQGPWGEVLADPSWGKVLEFSPGIPLWPSNLGNPQPQIFNVRYSIPGGFASNLRWSSRMKVFGWEKIAVPAGQFIALHYENQIVYTSPNFSKTDCERRENLWFVPSVGRWVAKETSGSCMQPEQTNDPNLQSSYRWELSSWK